MYLIFSLKLTKSSYLFLTTPLLDLCLLGRFKQKKKKNVAMSLKKFKIFLRLTTGISKSYSSRHVFDSGSAKLTSL